MKNFVLVKFKKPIKDFYYSHPNCPPRERGEGCYGDCIDCYHRDCRRYEGYLKKQKEKK